MLQIHRARKNTIGRLWEVGHSFFFFFSERVAICRKRNLSSPTAEKVFPKLKISISDAEVSRIVMSKPGAIEDLLLQVKSSVREHTYTPTHTLTQFIVFFFFYRLTRDGERWDHRKKHHESTSHQYWMLRNRTYRLWPQIPDRSWRINSLTTLQNFNVKSIRKFWSKRSRQFKNFVRR